MKFSVFLVVQIASISAHKWENWGGGIDNMRFQEEETKISVDTVRNLREKWVYETRGDVSCTPTERDGIVYFTDFGGGVYAVDEDSGESIWRRWVRDLTDVSGATSRSSPVIVDDKIIIGTSGRNKRDRTPIVQGPANLIALNKLNGDLIWSTKLDDHPHSRITQSGTYYDGHIYVGVSSFEEISADDDDYECCTFRGSLVKVDVNTGEIVWKTYMVPDNDGRSDLYSGNAIWGSSPAIDPDLNMVFIATGNTYDAPKSVIECIANEVQRDEPDIESCIDPDHHPDSVVALDLTSGEVVWGTLLEIETLLDAWNAECWEIFNDVIGANCPDNPGPDYDFAQAPLLTHTSDGRSVALIAQKSGMAWSLDRATGEILWGTLVGEGGILGGSEWGSASDGQRFYVGNSNYHQRNTTLINGQITNGGHWAALNIDTGEKIWETAVPVTWHPTSDEIAWAHGPLSVANGVLFAGTTDVDGHLFAMDASTGEILYELETGGTLVGGVSISSGCILLGCGYLDSLIGAATEVYKFSTNCRKVYSLCV